MTDPRLVVLETVRGHPGVREALLWSLVFSAVGPSYTHEEFVKVARSLVRSGVVKLERGQFFPVPSAGEARR